MPPVSTTVKAIPAQSESPRIRSRVVPGISDVTAFRSPTSLLNRVDFPTLGRPTSATSGLIMLNLVPPESITLHEALLYHLHSVYQRPKAGFAKVFALPRS